ncbi:MAG: hypothetical protein WKG06_17860 [Segetibacter sp.]
MTTIINADGISYGWNIPASELNSIKWSDIEACKMIEYKFVGFGYRIRREYGIVYNANGNKGLRINKKNGRKILLGTSKPEQAETAIKKNFIGLDF